eukprot:Gregarina_sp_Poly_1__3224@NODE_191_length_11641_cov_669_281061_g170_i0_p7_GENE_NODE_191_length_11641_cov_669_281061_g170_i0NODE_191_length_11641_cov_669_281061_g170_i0_p7_ORF_typecomplete_len215_score26_88_NODE_191_length_11641_cov_669_281061_g170_i032303874
MWNKLALVSIPVIAGIELVLSDWTINRDDPSAKCPAICNRPAFRQLPNCLAEASKDCKGNATVSIDNPYEYDEMCNYIGPDMLVAGFPNYVATLDVGFETNFTFEGVLSVAMDGVVTSSCRLFLTGEAAHSDPVLDPSLGVSGICGSANYTDQSRPIPDSLGGVSTVILPAATLFNIPSPNIYIVSPANPGQCGLSVAGLGWFVDAHFEWHGLA